MEPITVDIILISMAITGVIIGYIRSRDPHD